TRTLERRDGARVARKPYARSQTNIRASPLNRPPAASRWRGLSTQDEPPPPAPTTHRVAGASHPPSASSSALAAEHFPRRSPPEQSATCARRPTDHPALLSLRPPA